MARAKRKQGTEGAADTSPTPPRKKARRVATSKPADSEENDTVEVKKSQQRKTKGMAGKEDNKKKKKKSRIEETTPPKKAKARRVKAKAKAPPLDSNSEEEEEVVVAPRKRATRPAPTIDLCSDSDTDVIEERPRKRLRRARANEDESDQEETSTKPQGRIRRRSEEPEKEAKDQSGWELDSDDDPEDLKLSFLPSSSQPTKKDVKASALARYTKVRKNKTSPAPVPADAQEEDEEEREFTPIPEVIDEEEEGEGVPDEDDDEGFIVPEDEAGADADANGDADDDANAALDLMRYSQRQLDEHFAVFVEYIIALYFDPDYLSTATEIEKAYFCTAVTALRRHIEPLAESMTLSTWKAPFIATLNLRPFLADGVSSDESGNCHACWTRGMYSCDISGSYVLSTKKGIYDPDTFQDKPEKNIRYGTATRFENNAEARNLPYPPRFELVIGQRCFNRAMAYHEARHYMYNVSVRVEEKIKSLCEGDDKLANDPNATLEAMKEENFIDYLWGRFKSDKKDWTRFANRKDHDSLV